MCLFLGECGCISIVCIVGYMVGYIHTPNDFKNTHLVDPRTCTYAHSHTRTHNQLCKTSLANLHTYIYIYIYVYTHVFGSLSRSSNHAACVRACVNVSECVCVCACMCVCHLEKVEFFLILLPLFVCFELCSVLCILR